MKRLIFVIMWCAHLNAGIAQLSFGITTGKTSTFIFPSDVIHVDRGTASVLVQPVMEASHVLLVKAVHASFEATNISVILNNGVVYSIGLHYDSLPADFLHTMPGKGERSIQSYADELLDFPKVAYGRKAQALDIRAAVTGIYVREGVLYFQLEIDNDGPLAYSFEPLQLFIRDKKKMKRTAMQEINIKPLHVAGASSSVPAFHSVTMVIAVEQFTIPEAKVFFLQILETNGGRHLRIPVRNKDIIKAVLLLH